MSMGKSQKVRNLSNKRILRWKLIRQVLSSNNLHAQCTSHRSIGVNKLQLTLPLYRQHTKLWKVKATVVSAKQKKSSSQIVPYCRSIFTTIPSRVTWSRRSCIWTSFLISLFIPAGVSAIRSSSMFNPLLPPPGCLLSVPLRGWTSSPLVLVMKSVHSDYQWTMPVPVRLPQAKIVIGQLAWPFGNIMHIIMCNSSVCDQRCRPFLFELLFVIKQWDAGHAIHIGIDVTMFKKIIHFSGWRWAWDVECHLVQKMLIQSTNCVLQDFDN